MRHLAPLLAALAASAPAFAGPVSPARHAAARAMFERLVDTPTVIGRSKVPELATYLAEQFRAAGFPAADVRALPYHTAAKDGWQADETAALAVRWRAPGKPGTRPIMLMGHMDVVEAKREDSTTDPFKLTERDGYYYGRGTIDMKAGLTGIAQALIDLRASGWAPKRDIVVFFSGDEETNGIGAIKGATEWLELLGRPEYGLNADGGGISFSEADKPLGATLQTAEKTYADYRFAVTNRGGHSSKPRTDNAIYQLSHALERLEAHRFPPQLNETSRAYFTASAKTETGATGAAVRRWLANPDDGAAADVVEADEKYVGLTRTRCVATRLLGGHANNALPQLATATVNCRIFPGVAPDAIRDELARIAGDGVAVTRLDANPATLASPLRADVTAAYTKAVATLHAGMPVFPEMSTGASDARPFRVAGVAVYGVGGGWLRVPADLRAHGKDERLPIAALDDNVAHWKVLVEELAGR